MENQNENARQQRGIILAQTARIQRTNDGWRVPSQSGQGHYIVISKGLETTCTCPDYETRRVQCKHIFAVEYVITHKTDSEGNVTVTQTVRKSYAQNWTAYDKAQTHEQGLFMEILGDLVNNVEQPEYKFGRPSLPVSDLIYGSVLKVFTTFSLRRFMTQMAEAKENGYVTTKPCYASIGHFMQREDIMPVLSRLVSLTSLPLSGIEHDFAIDSTGFGTGNFQRWFSYKHGKEINSRKWVKCHFITGVKTNIVTSVKITTEVGNDSPQLPALVQETAEHFDMQEVSADKAYLGKENLQVVHDIGATPFIPFKTNNKPSGNGMLWKKMYHYFQYNNQEFMAHYHKRSNVETTVMMIKAKFGNNVRSKTWTAQINEVLCKVIAHNICVLIQEMHVLGIKPNFVEDNYLNAEAFGVRNSG